MLNKGTWNQLKLNVIVIVTTNKQIFGDGGGSCSISRKSVPGDHQAGGKKVPVSR